MTPERHGKAVYLTLEFEAVEIMHKLAESGHSYGKLVSLLLRQEEQRRIEARRLRDKLYDAVQGAVAP